MTSPRSRLLQQLAPYWPLTVTRADSWKRYPLFAPAGPAAPQSQLARGAVRPPPPVVGREPRTPGSPWREEASAPGCCLRSRHQRYDEIRCPSGCFALVLTCCWPAFCLEGPFRGALLRAIEGAFGGAHRHHHFGRLGLHGNALGWRSGSQQDKADVKIAEQRARPL